MTDFERFKVKSYSQWDLFLHKNQFPYIGRVYAWAKRPEADLVTDMGVREGDELLYEIIPDWVRAIRELWGDHRPNVSILGNESPHLHAHLVPRRRSPITFEGIEFVDPNPNGHYSPYPRRELDEKTLIVIRDLIKGKI